MSTSSLPDLAKRLVKQISDDEVPDVAAGLAYRFLFAIFPFAIFLAALSGFIGPIVGIGDPTDELLGALSDNLPPDVAAQLRPQLEAVLGQTRPGLLSIGAVTALWAATGGIAAVIKGMNRAYDVEETRGFIARTGTAVGLTILGSAGIIIAFVTIVGGSILTEQAAGVLGLDTGTWSAISLLRFPLVLAIVALAVAVLFKLGPNVRVSFRWTLVGGAVFALGWMLGTVLFGIYVANFASYADTYGALGGVVIMMLWFYLTGLLLLVAAEVTSLLAKEFEPELLAARREQLQTSVPRAAGRVVGTAVGAVEAAVESSDEDGGPGGRGEPGRASDTGEPRSRRRPAAPAPASVASRRASNQASGSAGRVALAVLAAGAFLGAIVGRLAGSDDEEAST